MIDFGIARAWESVYQTASRVIGSAHFMAPEQVDNKPLGPPVDMFSWGSTMVFAATGRHAFPGSNPVAVGLRVVQDEPELHDLDRAAGRPGARLPDQGSGPAAHRGRGTPDADGAGRPARHGHRPVRHRHHRGPCRPARDPPHAGPARSAAGRAGTATRAAAAAGPGRPVLLTVLLLALVGAGAGWAWRQRDRGGGTSATPSASPDPNLTALQAFAGDIQVGQCPPLTPDRLRQAARRSCTVDGSLVTFSLYKAGPVDERSEERKRVLRIHENNSPAACKRATGVSRDGRRGEYIEYTYLAGDDKKWYVAIWWDDGIDNPDGAGVMTMRQAWDNNENDPAAALREKWLSWGYKLEE